MLCPPELRLLSPWPAVGALSSFSVVGEVIGFGLKDFDRPASEVKGRCVLLLSRLDGFFVWELPI